MKKHVWLVGFLGCCLFLLCPGAAHSQSWGEETSSVGLEADSPPQTPVAEPGETPPASPECQESYAQAIRDIQALFQQLMQQCGPALGNQFEFYLLYLSIMKLQPDPVVINDPANPDTPPEAPAEPASGSAQAPEPPVSDPETPGSTEPSGPGELKKPASKGGTVQMDVPKLCQMHVDCPNWKSACGPTALAMAIAYRTGQDPKPLAAQLWDECNTSSENGTGHKGLVDGAKAHGFPNAKMSYNKGLSWLKAKIKSGRPVIAHVKNHYVLVTGYDAKGNILINDPGKGVVRRSMPWTDFSAWWTRSKGSHAGMVLE